MRLPWTLFYYSPAYCVYVGLSVIAGHYVPATGQVIVESNSVFAKNLKGIGIGNGWVDPYLQYAAYGEVAHSYLHVAARCVCVLLCTVYVKGRLY